MDGDYESVTLVKPEIFVYRIPPLGTNRGYKAADWKLDSPDWTGRMKLVAIGKRLELRLEDKSTGALYAKCPIEAFPGVCIEPVTDSSRYFVIRLKNDAGQTAFDHFKYIEKSSKFEEASTSHPSLDLAFKDGQTISINIGKKSATGQPLPTRSRPQPPPIGGNIPLLPPPPGSSSVGFFGHECLVLPSSLLSCVAVFISSGCSIQVFQMFPQMFDAFPQPAAQPSGTAIRRLQRDFQRLQSEPIDGITAVPNDQNILEWHYVIKGSSDTPYEGGYYYGKMVFQPDFPWKPPAICMLTPNGRLVFLFPLVFLFRFETNVRLCLSISDYHPESWNPGWTVSSILVRCYFSYIICSSFRHNYTRGIMESLCHS
uniref:UBIQUITIN_CONJUGAT_2 domain-containing protein n=1 Tax=Angiostrongylus cantonensis TaxID=6313 RepID=A0A158P7D1_ANGCA